MPFAAKVWSPKSSPRSKSRSGGRRSARCCCIERPRNQRSSSASPSVFAAATDPHDSARPPKPPRSRSESRLSQKPPAFGSVTHRPLPPPLLCGLELDFAEKQESEQDDGILASACPITDSTLKQSLRNEVPEEKNINLYPPGQTFKYEDDELVKLQECATCKQAWRAAFDAHRQQAVLAEQTLEQERVRSAKTKKTLLRERTKMAKAEADRNETMESLRGALKREQAAREEAEKALECERNRCAVATEAFESVQTQFEMLQVVLQELQPLLGQLARGIVMESHAMHEHIEDLTKTAVDRLMSFSELAEKAQQFVSSSEDDVPLCGHVTATLPSLGSSISTRTCSSNSSCDEELDVSTESIGHQQLSLTVQAKPPISEKNRRKYMSVAWSLGHDDGNGCESDVSSEEEKVVLMRPCINMSKVASRPTTPAPNQPRPVPLRKASIL